MQEILNWIEEEIERFDCEMMTEEIEDDGKNPVLTCPP
jgi:hypothetical protein